MKGGFEITGVKEVLNIMEDVAPKHARNLMRATIHGVAATIAKEARTNAPKNSGDLRKAIKSRRKKSPPDAPVSEVIVTTGKRSPVDAFYWRFVEYGTRHQAERPFIRPAADEAKKNFDRLLVAEFGKKLEKAITREAKKRAAKK